MNEPLPDPGELEDQLLDASVTGGFDAELALAILRLDAASDELGALDRFRYRMLFFDLASVSSVDRAIQLEVAEALLAAAIEAGYDVWEDVIATDRWAELERLASSADDPIGLLELLSYAPDAGVRAFALARIETAGVQMLDGGGDSRPVERLLHGIGASEAGYRLEALRKQSFTDSARAVRPAERSGAVTGYRRVAIAGGHAQLRTTAARLLDRHGVTVVPVPSSRESVRRERDIARALQGCDAAIVLVRQITHSTSDQVRRTAERLGIPVLFSNALSAIAIERQLFGPERLPGRWHEP